MLSLLGIKYPSTVAKEITLRPCGFKSQKERLRLWKRFKWATAPVYTKFLRRIR
jgi:hypothetical protein